MSTVAAKHFAEVRKKLDLRGGAVCRQETDVLAWSFFQDCISAWQLHWPRDSWSEFCRRIREHMPLTFKVCSRGGLQADVDDVVMRWELDALFRACADQPPRSGRAFLPGEAIVGCIQGYCTRRKTFAGILEYFPDVGTGLLPRGEVGARRTAHFDWPADKQRPPQSTLVRFCLSSVWVGRWKQYESMDWEKVATEEVRGAQVLPLADSDERRSLWAASVTAEMDARRRLSQ